MLKHYKYIYRLIMTVLCAFAIGLSASAQRKTITAPDLPLIKAETTDPSSKYYYPKLLKEFMSNDTVMTNDDYRYLYYGTLFQEDYDPYREQYSPERYAQVAPLYTKSNLTGAEKELILNYAIDAMGDNPMDLEQLRNRIFVYEQRGKVNLANIWRTKLNHLLYVIATSGSGLDPQSAWILVYPSHEFEFVNLQGLTITDRQYIEPHYEHITVMPRSDRDPVDYYFDLAPMLEQYYLKHPSEL